MAVVRGAYHAYFHAVLPAVGRVVSGHRTAYRYLPESVAHFPVQEQLARAMREAGFVDVQWESLTLGVAAIHSGDKRSEERRVGNERRCRRSPHRARRP